MTFYSIYFLAGSLIWFKLKIVEKKLLMVLCKNSYISVLWRPTISRFLIYFKMMIIKKNTKYHEGPKGSKAEALIQRVSWVQ